MIKTEKRVQKHERTICNLRTKKNNYIRNNGSKIAKMRIKRAIILGDHNKAIESRFEILDLGIESKHKMGREEAKLTKRIKDYEKKIQDFDTKIAGHQVEFAKLSGNEGIESRFDILDL